MAWRQHGRKEEQGDEDRRRGLWERARRAAKVRKKGKREWEALQIADIYMVQPDGQPRKLSVYHEEERMTSRLSSTSTWLLQSPFSVAQHTSDFSQNHQQDYIEKTI